MAYSEKLVLVYFDKLALIYLEKLAPIYLEVLKSTAINFKSTLHVKRQQVTIQHAINLSRQAANDLFQLLSMYSSCRHSSLRPALSHLQQRLTAQHSPAQHTPYHCAAAGAPLALSPAAAAAGLAMSP